MNDEGVPIVLDLLDQVHGLRRALRRVGSALQGLPEPLRREILTRLQGSCEEMVGRTGEEPRSGVG